MWCAAARTPAISPRSIWRAKDYWTSCRPTTPSSLLMAALQLPQRVPAIDLASAIRTVTKTPAEAVGLADRGEIAIGKRADLIRVHVAPDVPVGPNVWGEGHRVRGPPARPHPVTHPPGS